jgi:hypothetical protein
MRLFGETNDQRFSNFKNQQKAHSNQLSNLWTIKNRDGSKSSDFYLIRYDAGGSPSKINRVNGNNINPKTNKPYNDLKRYYSAPTGVGE